MKKKNLLLTILLAILVFGGGSKALAKGSLFGWDDNASYYDNSSRGGMLREGGIDITTGEGFSLGGAQNEDPTTDVPVGCGIAILLAAGAGYTLMKRKEEQK